MVKDYWAVIFYKETSCLVHLSQAIFLSSRLEESILNAM